MSANSMRAELLDTVTEGAKLYIATVESINAKRSHPKTHISYLHPDIYRKVAEYWLTDERLAAALVLPVDDDRPRLMVPRLTHPVTIEENRHLAWKPVAPRGLWSWGGREKFLHTWTHDEFSGFKADWQKQMELPFEILPTAYDADREGNITQQTEILQDLQNQHPMIETAPLWAGAVLARRYAEVPPDLRDTFVRITTFETSNPDRDHCVAYAYVDPDDKDVVISDSYTPPRYAARLRVV
jgi:hypothetical protein